MGNFYVNHTVRTEDRVKLRSVLRHNKLTAYISPAKNGCVVVAEQQAATQATAPIVSLAKLLSIEAQAPVLVAADHDDDFLHLALYESGQEITDYSSDPSHVVEDKETDLAGKAAKLCTAFDVPEACGGCSRDSSSSIRVRRRTARGFDRRPAAVGLCGWLRLSLPEPRRAATRAGIDQDTIGFNAGRRGAASPPLSRSWPPAAAHTGLPEVEAWAGGDL